MKPKIFFISNQLRILDNPILERAKLDAEPIIIIHFLPDLSSMNPLTLTPRFGELKKKYYLGSLIEFRTKLQNRGNDLILLNFSEDRQNEFYRKIHELMVNYSVRQIFLPAESSYHEILRNQKIEILAENLGIHCTQIDCNSMILEEDLGFPLEKLPSVFTEFRKKLEVDQNYPVRLEAMNCKQIGEGWTDFPIPSFPRDSLSEIFHESDVHWKKIRDSYNQLDELSGKFTPGEDGGLNRLREYIWEKNLLQTYKETRNEMLGMDYSSKFSPWLAWGCLSPVRIYCEILKYETSRVSNESTYWMKFELLWRDFFRFVGKKYGKKLFLKSGIKEKILTKANEDISAFEIWKSGKTGQKFIDANMIELMRTGYMSNRGRQNVASYLVHDLGLDWRMGAEWFESQLVDYDPTSNWGNWNYIAGTGNDPRNRKFNVEKQARDYDPQGEYQEYWLKSMSNKQVGN